MQTAVECRSNFLGVFPQTDGILVFRLNLLIVMRNVEGHELADRESLIPSGCRCIIKCVKSEIINYLLCPDSILDIFNINKCRVRTICTTSPEQVNPFIKSGDPAFIEVYTYLIELRCLDKYDKAHCQCANDGKDADKYFPEKFHVIRYLSFQPHRLFLHYKI